MFGFVFNPVNFWLCHDSLVNCACCWPRSTTPSAKPIFFADRARAGADPRQAKSAVQQAVFTYRRSAGWKGNTAFAVSSEPGLARVAIDYFDADGLLLKTACGASRRHFPWPICAGHCFHPLMTLAVVRAFTGRLCGCC